MIANIFQNSNIIIYENDSIDKTLRILQKWAKNSKYNIKIISEKNVPGKRTHRLAHGRNILLNEALILNNDYFVVIDLDNVINDLTIDSFNTCFNYNNIDWAMLGANQEEFYYDIWALRTKDNWLNFDWAKCHYDLGDTNFCLKSRIRKLKIQDELIEVDSCFGGLAIYKTKYLKNCKYYGGDDDDEICEHVPFHDDIRRKNNGRIFINTKLINCLKYN